MSANENMGYGNMGAKIKSKHSKSFVTLDFFVFCYFIVFVFLECHNICIYITKWRKSIYLKLINFYDLLNYLISSSYAVILLWL